MSITPEEKLKRIRDSINDIKSVTEVMIKARIKTVSPSSYTIENKDIADALVEFAEGLVKVCGNPFDSKCEKALYLQKVIKLKTKPENYKKNITITDDINNIDSSTPDPTVEKDADDDDDSSKTVTSTDGTPVTTVNTVVSTDSTGDGTPVTTVDPALVTVSPVVSTDSTGDGAKDDGAKGDGTTVPVPIANTTDPSAVTSTGPLPASVAPVPSDKNRVILSYVDGSYLVKDEFKSNYHVLERKDETQCFAYNPSYNPPKLDSMSEQGALQGFGKTLSGAAVNVGNTLSGAAVNAGKTLSGVAENAGKTLTGAVKSVGNFGSGALQSFKNKFGTNRENYATTYDPTNSPLHKGGKRRTKKRRITRKRNQQKLRLFKSRSKK